MFKAVTRKDYTVTAAVEAENIRKAQGAYKVIYKGSRLFIVFDAPKDESDYYRCALRYAKEHGQCAC